jgi:hypothetical protein
MPAILEFVRESLSHWRPGCGIKNIDMPLRAVAWGNLFAFSACARERRSRQAALSIASIQDSSLPRLELFWLFEKIEVFGAKFFEIASKLYISGPQAFAELADEVFQVHDPNPGSERLKSTRPDDRFLLSQASVSLWKQEDGNVTGCLV